MTKRILLAGGGHSHALALLWLPALARGAEIILVSDGEFAPYSGMLPGVIGGQFAREESLINLPALCQKAGAKWRCGTVTAVRAAERRVIFADGNVESYDLLSLNVGGVPKPLGAGIGIKPVLSFMSWLDNLPPSPSLAIIGGGIGGVETALALRRRFVGGEIVLIGNAFLPHCGAAVRRRLQEIIKSRGIEFVESAATGFVNGGVLLANGRRILSVATIFATPVCAPRWLSDTDLSLDDGGFVRVNEYLQSVSSAAVFAVGDCAATAAPKSGAVAVRQAPILAANLAAAIVGAPLRPWRLRKQLLAIINTADGRAVANWGNFSASGVWVWNWKKYLDKKFMNRFLV